jgi:hypothetical protein
MKSPKKTRYVLRMRGVAIESGVHYGNNYELKASSISDSQIS